VITYNIKVKGIKSNETYSCDVNLIDNDNQYVVKGSLIGKEGVLKVALPNLWWPRSMSDNPGYLYTLEVTSAYYEFLLF
jgi:beta-glucuronidase